MPASHQFLASEFNVPEAPRCRAHLNLVVESNIFLGNTILFYSNLPLSSSKSAILFRLILSTSPIFPKAEAASDISGDATVASSTILKHSECSDKWLYLLSKSFKHVFFRPSLARCKPHRLADQWPAWLPHCHTDMHPWFGFTRMHLRGHSVTACIATVCHSGHIRHFPKGWCSTVSILSHECNAHIQNQATLQKEVNPPTVPKKGEIGGLAAINCRKNPKYTF